MRADVRVRQTAVNKKIARQLAEIGRRFYTRGWMMGTSGNLSAVVARKPLRLAITASGLQKRELAAADILEIDQRGNHVQHRHFKRT